MSDRDREYIRVRCYTKAHRTALVIGKLGDFRLPTPLTIPQAAAIAVSFWILWNTRNLWSIFTLGNGYIKFIILCGAPVGLGLVVRYAKVEGRKPHQAFVGIFSARVVHPLTRRLSIKPGGKAVRARWSPYFGGEAAVPLVAAGGERAREVAKEREGKRKKARKERAAAAAAARKKARSSSPPRLRVKRRKRK